MVGEGGAAQRPSSPVLTGRRELLVSALERVKRAGTGSQHWEPAPKGPLNPGLRKMVLRHQDNRQRGHMWSQESPLGGMACTCLSCFPK